MKNLLLIALCAISLGAFAQVQINKPLQLSGSGADARIEGIDDVSANDHAANKIYVDTAIANRAGGGGGASHYIGELYGGGIIVSAYTDQFGAEHGLIATLTDVSTGTAWSNVTGTEVGAAAQSSWDGQGNTVAIIAQIGHTSSAAQLCADYSHTDSSGTYNDWYLPALQELQTVWNSLYIINSILSSEVGTDLFTEKYWTSKENNATSVRSYQFGYGDTASNGSGKTGPHYVRCFRKY